VTVTEDNIIKNAIRRPIISQWKL